MGARDRQTGKEASLQEGETSESAQGPSEGGGVCGDERRVNRCNFYEGHVGNDVSEV